MVRAIDFLVNPRYLNSMPYVTFKPSSTPKLISPNHEGLMKQPWPPIMRGDGCYLEVGIPRASSISLSLSPATL